MSATVAPLTASARPSTTGPAASSRRSTSAGIPTRPAATSPTPAHTAGQPQPGADEPTVRPATPPRTAAARTRMRPVAGSRPTRPTTAPQASASTAPAAATTGGMAAAGSAPTSRAAATSASATAPHAAPRALSRDVHGWYCDSTASGHGLDDVVVHAHLGLAGARLEREDRAVLDARGQQAAGGVDGLAVGADQAVAPGRRTRRQHAQRPRQAGDDLGGRDVARDPEVDPAVPGGHGDPQEGADGRRGRARIGHRRPSCASAGADPREVVGQHNQWRPARSSLATGRADLLLPLPPAG